MLPTTAPTFFNGHPVYTNTGSIWSEDKLSSKEVGLIKKWVAEKDRSDRKENIVIKRIMMPEVIDMDNESRVE